MIHDFWTLPDRRIIHAVAQAPTSSLEEQQAAGKCGSDGGVALTNLCFRRRCFDKPVFFGWPPFNLYSGLQQTRTVTEHRALQSLSLRGTSYCTLSHTPFGRRYVVANGSRLLSLFVRAMSPFPAFSLLWRRLGAAAFVFSGAALYVFRSPL